MHNHRFKVLSSGANLPRGCPARHGAGCRRGVSRVGREIMSLVPGSLGRLLPAQSVRDEAQEVPAHGLDPAVGRARGRADDNPALSPRVSGTSAKRQSRKKEKQMNTNVRNNTAHPIHLGWTDRLPPVPGPLRPEHFDVIRGHYGDHLIGRRVDIEPGGVVEIDSALLARLREHDDVIGALFAAGDLTVEAA